MEVPAKSYSFVTAALNAVRERMTPLTYVA